MDKDKITLKNNILEIASNLLNASNHTYRDSLDNALEIIKQNLDVERISFIEYNKEPDNQIFDYITKGFFEKLLESRETFIVKTLENTDKTQKLYQVLKTKKINSVSFLPLYEQGDCLGFIVIEDGKKTRRWTQSEIVYFDFIALVIAKTLKTNELRTQLLKFQKRGKVFYNPLNIKIEDNTNHIKKQTKDYESSNNNIEKTEKDDLYQTRLCGYALVVDDNRLNRLSLQRELKKQGVKSKVTTSGLEAIEVAKSEIFDMILMDIHMPEMDGVETTRKIRLLSEANKRVPIIALTVNPFLKDYDFLKTSQMNDVLIKPITNNDLDQILRKYISSYTSINVPEQLFIFDQVDFEQRFEGSLDIAQEVISSFIADYSNDLEEVRIAVSSNNAKHIRQRAHYFIGSCSYLSGKRVVWLLNLLIQYAKNEQFKAMDLCVELLEEELQKLVDKIIDYQERELY